MNAMDAPRHRTSTEPTEWTPPLWLRKLHVAAREPVPAQWTSMSPADRLERAFELMSFAHERLREQAAERGCTVGALLRTYDEATARLRARD